MEDFLEDELFFKDTGMDQDSEARFIEGYFKLLNGRNANGKVSNIPSALLITNPYLPAVGTNLCTGSFEDQRDNSCIFFNFNSLGFHGIYRYYRNVPGFTNGEIQLLRQVKFPLDYTFDNPNPLNFDDNPTNVITGIALVDNKLYWNQPNDKPKMLDAARSNVTRKRFRFNLLLNRTNFVASIAVGGVITYTLNVYKSGNPVPIHTFVWTSSPTSNTYALRVQDFVDAYNASPLTMAQFHLINKEDFVQIEMSKEGDFYLDLSETLAADLSIVRISLVTADNFYPEKDSTLPVSYPTFKVDLISRIRYPSLIEPSCTYKTDTKRPSNLVKGKVFQFRMRYNYFDYSKSCLGAISNIADNTPLNIDSAQTVLNYIEVDFTDARLSDTSLASIFRTVDLLVREHNTGPWKIAQTLKPYEFAGTGQQTVKFYNDGNFATIDDAEAIKQYDSTGRECKSLEMVGDMLFDGGILEGYNKPEINAKIDVTYGNQESPTLYSVKGAVYIFNVFALNEDPDNGTSMSLLQGIQSNTNSADNLSFGGMSYRLGLLGADHAYVEILDPAGAGANNDKFAQRIPLGGFTFYLAGTDFKGTSKQVYGKDHGISWNIQDNGGWYHAQSNSDRMYYRFNLNNTGLPPSPLPLFPNMSNPFTLFPGTGPGIFDQNGGRIGQPVGDGLVYSTFEIRNVPAGTYVLRCASHLLTDAELNNGTRDYQNSSTNIMEIGGLKDFEAVIVVGPSTAYIPPSPFLEAAYGKNVVFVGRTVVADLARPKYHSNFLDTKESYGVCGYVTDHDNPALTGASTYKELLTDTKIENTFVNIVNGGFGPYGYYFPFVNTYPLLTLWLSNKARCDHNGYFYFATTDNGNIQAGTNFATPGGTAYAIAVIKDYYGGAWTNQVVDGSKTVVFRNTDDTISTDHRTYVKGTVLNSAGLVQPAVAVVLTHGKTAETDGGGQYSIVCYVRNSVSDPDLRDDFVVFSSSSLTAQFSFVTAIIAVNFEIGTGGGQYNSTTFYFVIDNVAVVIVYTGTGISAMKRGWDGRLGIVYYNDADQKCAVATIDALQLHILFYTEKDPVTGLQVNTGYPILTWTIFHRPPDWAVKYQWVRQANQQMEIWLQWIANKVEYINDNDDGTVYPLPSSPGASMCKINLDNIGYYTINKHPNAVINFTYQKGDRIRPIRDAKGNLFPNYYEFEILKVVGTDVYIYKDVSIIFEKGTLFEMFTPRGDEGIKVFSEFGECYEVKTAVIQGVRQKYHAGPVQDQTYGPVPTQTVTPAIGVFNVGDAYYRTREMQIGTVLATDIAPYQASSEGNILRFIDDASVSDFYESRDLSIGRVNLEFGIRELFRQSTVRFTNRYLSDTETNGLSSNEPLNEKQFSNEFGLIMKLILVGNDVLKAIFSNSWQVSMYINKNILREASGHSLIAISDDVIPRTNENKRTFGTQHPESISITTNGVVFGWDEKVGVYWADYGNGLIPVSEYKMSNYFTQKSIERLLPGFVTLNPAIYDVGNGQLLHTFGDKFTNITRLPKATVRLNNFTAPIDIILKAYPSNTTLIQVIGAYDPNLSTALMIRKYINAGTVSHGFTAVVNENGWVDVYAPKVDPLYSFGTLVLTFGAKDSYTFQFDEGLQILPGSLIKETVAFTIGEKGTPKDRWPQFYSFTPEFYGRTGNDVMGFDNGQLWLHEKGVDFNMFYGVFYPLQVIQIFKKDWQKNKVYKGKSYKSKSLDFYVPSATTPATADYPTGQFTKISKANFKAMQAGVYAKMNNDGNDTRFANQVDAIMSGRPMRGSYIQVTLENDSRGPVELFSTKIIYFYSELS